MSSDEVTIDVRLVNLAGALMEGPRKDDIKPDFDVNVKLEEMERGTGQATFSFALAISTKPNIVKFDINGTVTVIGGNEVVEKLLQTNPETKVPNLLERVYERIFTSVFLLSSSINAPAPPPDLIRSSAKSQVAEPEKKLEEKKPEEQKQG
jgi:hypothetical protein